MEGKDPARPAKGDKKKKSKGSRRPEAVVAPQAPLAVPVVAAAPPVAETKARPVPEKGGAKKKSSKRAPPPSQVEQPAGPKPKLAIAIEAVTPILRDDGNAEMVDDDDNDGYGDDFEDYSDDAFEADDGEAPSGASLPPSTVLSGVRRRHDATPGDDADLRDLQAAMREENSAAMERRRAEAEDVPEAKSARRETKGGKGAKSAKASQPTR